MIGSLKRASLVVLVSGNGSNLQAILDAVAERSLPAQVVAVFSNNPAAYGLERARLAGVPAVALPKQKGQTRQDYDRELARQVSAYQPDWIILAGWMRILSVDFLNRFHNRVVNLHPALPGTFPGTHGIQEAFEAFHAGMIQHTGIMVHLVPDEAVDAGPVLAQEVVPIYSEDTLSDLEQRIHAVEHRLLVSVITRLVQSKDASFYR